MRARCRLRARHYWRFPFAGTTAGPVHHFAAAPLPCVATVARSVQLGSGFIAHCARALLIPFHSAPSLMRISHACHTSDSV